MKKVNLLVFIAVVFIATACAQTPAEQNSRTLMVMTHDSFAVSESVVASFEKTKQSGNRLLKVAHVDFRRGVLHDLLEVLPYRPVDVALAFAEVFVD